ncbi:MAG: SpoIID/LytB domain-containing protein [Clostridia bacterium]|nr:SpoIID/LytB domain-containing protein [Clostridia bacterium]
MPKKRTRAEKQRLITQILCLVLAALMILGVLLSILPFSYLTAHASDSNSDTTQTTENLSQNTETNESLPADPFLLRIGLMFGSGVTESFAVRAENGFSISHVRTSDDAATPLYETTEPYLCAARDGNLAFEDGIYTVSSKNVVIGGYHLQLPTDYKSMEALTDAVASINDKLKTAGIYSSLIYAFPAYVNGAFFVRIGDFGSTQTAAAQASLIKTATGEAAAAVQPHKDGVTVIAPDRNLIVFEYTSSDGMLGLSAIQTGDTESYIVTPAKNTYRGTFLFSRYENGIAVTNLIDLENYVAGILPYEISNSWPADALRSFACIVRSYSLANLRKHASLGIDLCNGTDCQVYMGTKSENDAVREAVNTTSGMIITYNGKPCNTFYSAVTGGCTVNIEQVWNGSTFPYLRAVSTPWEDYASHPNGVWMSEVSGYELYTYLYNKGYTNLRGTISDVSIVELAQNSTYVYRLNITDIYGNTVALKGTDIVRTGLGRYLKSANFVVGHKGSIPILNRIVEVLTANGTATLPIIETETEETKKSSLRVLTAEGEKDLDVTDGMYVLQADGTKKLITEKGEYDIPDDAKDRLNSGTSNFLFIGKGWGHGVGVSQWGIMNLAKAGCPWEDIIHAYFTNVVIAHWNTLGLQ